MSRRKYYLNEDYFKSIDNEHKAYWLGFIYADGCLAYNSHSKYTYLDITLKESDGYLLNNFVKDLESNYKVIIKYNNLNKMCASLQIYSIRMAKYLMKLGVHRNKTCDCIFPNKNQVPQEFLSHFIRGFMDGDGSISICNTSKNKDFSLKFIGTYDMMNKIKLFFNRETLINRVKKCQVPIYTFEIHGNRETEKALSILYNNATIFLKRKYNRYIELINLNLKYDLKIKEEQLKIKQQVIELYKKGYSYQAISNLTGHATNTITSIIKPIRDKKLKNIDNDIINMFRNGVSKLKICEITGRSRDYIRKITIDINKEKILKNQQCRDDIIKLYKKGISKKEISNIMNVSYKKVIYTINKFYKTGCL